MIIKLENIERTFNKNINVLKGVNVWKILYYNGTFW